MMKSVPFLPFIVLAIGLLLSLWSIWSLVEIKSSSNSNKSRIEKILEDVKSTGGSYEVRDGDTLIKVTQPKIENLVRLTFKKTDNITKLADFISDEKFLNKTIIQKVTSSEEEKFVGIITAVEFRLGMSPDYQSNKDTEKNNLDIKLNILTTSKLSEAELNNKKFEIKGDDSSQIELTYQKP